VGSLALVRHGQASFGAADYDRLSDRGAQQARALGVRWAAEPPDVIYTGPMQRQRDTARIARAAAAAAGRELPEPVELAGLGELPAFELVARCLPAVAREHDELRALIAGTAAGSDRGALWDRAFWTILDGWSRGRLDIGGLEAYDAFAERVDGALAWIAARHRERGARIAAVTSGGPIGVALRRALGLDVDGMLKLWRVIRNASVTELRWRSSDAAGALSVLGFNHVDHLPADLQTYR
jgi:broad specificity phosphatase PhoE